MRFFDQVVVIQKRAGALEVLIGRKQGFADDQERFRRRRHGVRPQLLNHGQDPVLFGPEDVFRTRVGLEGGFGDDCFPGLPVLGDEKAGIGPDQGFGALFWRAGQPGPGLTRQEVMSQADRQTSTLRLLLAGLDQADPKGEGLTASQILEIVANALDKHGLTKP